MIAVALAPLGAHHVISAKFDNAKTVTLRGAVTQVDWANPHAHVFINVAEPDGRVTNSDLPRDCVSAERVRSISGGRGGRGTP